MATPKIDPRKDGPRKAPPATPLRAYAAWGLFAAIALVAAGGVFVWRDGKAPIAQVQAPPPQPQVVVNPNPEREINRLNEAVRVLAAERDRLANRLDELERSVTDITASIPQKKKLPAMKEDVPPAPPTAPPLEVVTPPNPQPRPQQNANNQFQTDPQNPAPQVFAPPPQQPVPPQQQQPQQPAPEVTNTIKTEFAVDLGGDRNVAALRRRWTSLRDNHGAIVENLRPLIQVKEGTKQGTVELRLVAGPIANAADAARVCARLQISNVPCVPTVFDGQRLSIR